MSKLAKALTAAAGNAGGGALYVEDVFSTYLYEGTGAGIAINNGINLSDEGGLVIYRRRDDAENWSYQDTERGVNSVIYSDSTNAAADPGGYGLASFNSDGFTTELNTSGADYASWTFRKAEKFFDVVTYTGTGTEQQIPHNLTSAAKFYVVKRTDAAGDWYVATPGLADWNNSYLVLNSTAAKVSLGDAWSTTSGAPYTTFGVMDGSTNNISGATYVAYLFASDAGGFGDDGSESIIKCGSYTGNGSTSGPAVNLGYEPQWVMIKKSSAEESWYIYDNMRGVVTGAVSAADRKLLANAANAEGGLASADPINFGATGFNIGTTDNELNDSGGTYIYIAIRRPMKTPESGTEVFNPDLADASVAPLWEAPFPVDLGMYAKRDSSTATFYAGTRLTGTGRLPTWDAAAEVTDGGFKWDYMDGWFNNAFTDSQYLGYGFKRATGFFDVVAYTGDGVTGRQISHNLTVAPEIVIVKNRNTPQNWYDYHSGDPTGYTQLNTSNPSQTDGKYYFGNDVEIIAPTSTVFTVGGANAGVSVNGSAETYIAYLFATLAGVSKVGSYTGTGADLNVDCGFSAGARFILIKRTDSTGDWYVYDSVRGIVAGNDPYLLLNTTAAEVTGTDYIDPLSSGFTVTSSAPAALNASGGTYIFLAIA
jgi:hypothetical protein